MAEEPEEEVALLLDVAQPPQPQTLALSRRSYGRNNTAALQADKQEGRQTGRQTDKQIDDIR